ncbi:MAG: LCP family protein [Erysipelotrichaceae bacterium]|nr:LCP family protein [Erysipelotrichaceae bacterium]
MNKRKSFFAQIKENQVSAISFVLSLIGIALTVLLTIIGNKYLGTKIVLLVAVIFGIVWLLLIALSVRKPKTSVFINLLLVIALSVSSVLAIRLSDFSGRITSYEDIDTISIIKAVDSDLTIDSNFFGLRLAIFSGDDDYNNWAISLLQQIDKYTGVITVEYSNHIEGFQALLAGDVDLMVMNTDGESEIQEAEDGILQSKQYKVLFTDSRNINTDELPTVDVSKNGFTVLINGVDLSGNNINKKARADINILATVNPSTGKVNLQVLPRDLWVEVPCRDNLKSKLTRTGSQGGSGCTIKAIEQYFDHELEINYYVKINFTGFVDLIDALGGITAYSYYNFCSGNYCFVKGKNKMNGEKALVFARIRKILPGNDLARGNHQLEISKGIINKFLENPSLDTMNKVLDAVEGNFVTTFEEKNFINLFNLFINMKDKMVIESHSMKGDFVWDFDPIYKTDLYYFVPTKGEKEAALQRIKDTLEGK